MKILVWLKLEGIIIEGLGLSDMLDRNKQVILLLGQDGCGQSRDVGRSLLDED